MGPSPTPTKDPCDSTKDGIKEPPAVEKAKRWALGYTTTTPKNPWKGAAVVWSNEEMSVPKPPPGGDRTFVDETLWVGTTSSNICWIEVGDGDSYDANQVHHRQYYWAENSLASGYHEFDLDSPAHPPLHRYQYYAVEWHDNTNQYLVTIGQQIVAQVPQPGDTLFAHVGLETTDPRALVLTPIKLAEFRVFDGRFWKAWPTHRASVDPPAWFIWTWPTARDGIPFFIIRPPFPPIGGGP